ncbi:hypothetical protein I0D00_09240 [Pseudomonas lalucatii]|uniref:DUF3077 domain-containing protein n=1 Tax=Pseudomonas lalucatii TaxID=1424203 RepID=A0ABS5Q0S7_9PSED|nr:hypothetical protein [Pseudomonas lalucatii]MBS7662120.1 hypothetical protein [Pseudomonas lalucatii]
MPEPHSPSPNPGTLRSPMPAALCDLASLRMGAVQALIKVLIDESEVHSSPRVPRHTLSAANALLTEADKLYREAFARLDAGERS